MGIFAKVSKSDFKARALEYLRRVEATGEELVVTDRGQAVVRIVPYTQPEESARNMLRGAVLHFDDPTEPVGLEDWEALF